MSDLSRALDDLAQRYVRLHRAKEDSFWVTKMGLAEDAQAAGLAAQQAEQAYNDFLQDPSRLAELRELEREAASAPTEEQRVLRGWIAMFAAHVVESPEGRALSSEIVELEGELARQRRAMPLGYVDPRTKQHVPASSVRLSLMLSSEPDEQLRKAAFEGLASIEGYVLDHGFLEIVKKRNRLARLLGYEDYYDFRVQVVERMSKRRLFQLLDELVERTQKPAEAELARCSAALGLEALQPWNFRYYKGGKRVARLHPYVRLAPALERWMRTFQGLGVRFRGATLTLDLIDRKGKYENGFMHGPGVAFFDHGSWQPATINFTANAVVGQLGAGITATQTLFHEGGHAAHFSNILEAAPCFAQEFAPTSVAYAETQSMFMDSLVSDPDWLWRYARDEHGAPPSAELLAETLREDQLFPAWDVRALVTVPFAERALYELSDDELRPERVLEVFRAAEQRLQGLSRGVRPVLAVPHLLSGESSAYYHGYVLAELAVQQTRRHFLQRDGYLTDNPRIGPELGRDYWAPGNAATFDETLVALTGSPLGIDALLQRVSRTPEQAVAEGLACLERAQRRQAAESALDLDAQIRVVHGNETVTSTGERGYEGAGRDFAEWVKRLEQQARAPS
ncbi:MAG TPA: M3 family metallopeptidase [Polyangiaceae bacterium]|nr:M3 family metallopeptidase [Polyangiaceae bacterium]